MKPKIKHVIFDWSGTLYDDHRPGFQATKKILKAKSGHNITFKEYKEHFTLPVLPFYRRYGIKDSLKQINDEYFDYYEHHFRDGQIFPGVMACLKLLKRQKITISIFSTVRQNQLDELCKIFKLKKYFKVIRGSVCDKRKEMKGHLKEIGVKPENILFIGDMDHDVEAGNKNGLISGCVMNGYHNTEKLLKAHPKFVWRHQEEWLPFFKSLQKPLKKKQAKPFAVSTSGAMVMNGNNKMLLVLTHKWGYTYGIPGGKIEKGETAEQAAKRELMEETGLNITVKDLVVVQDCIDSKEFYIPKSHFLLFNYLAKTKNKKVKLNYEALSHIWVDPKLALNLNLNEPTRILIAKYLSSFLK